MNIQVPKFRTSGAPQSRARQLILGSCHTYSKGADEYLVQAPGIIVRGDGVRIWDTDGNRHIEYGMGNRAVGLGHAHPKIVEAVKRELANGYNFTRPAKIEVGCELTGL